MFWKKLTEIWKRFIKRLKANTLSENLESIQAKQASKIDLERMKRDSAVIFEKIGRRI